YELDPESPIINQGAVWISVLNEDYERAWRHYQVTREMFTVQPFSPALAEFLALAGRAGELERYLEAYPDGIGHAYMDCIASAGAAGDPESASKQKQKLELLNSNPAAKEFCLMHMGKADEAFEIAQELIDLDITNIQLFWWPGKDTAILRQSPRFREILEETGLADFYREYGLPDLCGAPKVDEIPCL
ncbi:MAG: hypothetical protein ACREO9_03210, partial [Lysobacterales bacterium]